VKDKDGKVIKTAGQQLDGFGQLQDDGSTMCGNWLHSGVYTEAGNLAQRRNNADPTGLGMFHNWRSRGRRIGASCTTRLGRRRGQGLGSTRPGIVWNGEKWVGDVPDIKPDSPPGQFGAFIMLLRAWAALRAGAQRRAVRRALRGGGGRDRQSASPEGDVEPVTKKFKSNKDGTGPAINSPSSARPTAHRALPLLTHHTNILNQLQPGFFIEIPEELAKEKASRTAPGEGDSARGSIEGLAW